MNRVWQEGAYVSIWTVSGVHSRPLCMGHPFHPYSIPICTMWLESHCLMVPERKKNDNDKVSFQLVWWHETRQWTFFFKVRLSHFPYFSVCYQFLEWVGAELKLHFSVVLFNLNFSRQVGRQMKNFLVNQNAVQRTVIFDFWQLTTFYKREHAALYLTALMELHVFHSKITFNDYIMITL